MEVVLLQDVKNVGKKGDVVTLKDGYARNLISKKQAAEASARVMNDLKLQKKHELLRLRNVVEFLGDAFDGDVVRLQVDLRRVVQEALDLLLRPRLCPTPNWRGSCPAWSKKNKKKRSS